MWPFVVACVVVASGAVASALALLPALLIGLVLLLRDTLGPAALPFGLLASVLAWLAPDLGSRAAAATAMMQGFDAGLGAHLLRPLLVSICALAPAAAILAPLRSLPRGLATLCRLAALGLAAVAVAWGGWLVGACLAPGLLAFVMRVIAPGDADVAAGPNN